MDFVTIHQKTAHLIARKLLGIDAIKLNYKNPFTWASGWKSPVYCDNRLALSYPDIRSLVKESLCEAIQTHYPKVECIAGVATAGIPQGVLVADALRLPFIYVRPKPKEHGMGNLIEGKVKKGQRAVLVEDLISTGGSSLKAATALREAGFGIEGMAAIFTYGFTISEKAFADEEVKLVCLSDFDHLLEAAIGQKYITENDLIYVKSWRLDPGNWK
ncbi:MAG: orotate phosphoribosyltransferase [Cytophagales bacterium]